MAYYTYKDLCYQIPSHIEERFVEEHGREPDGDPNYNGDYWTLAAMYVAELESDVATMRKLLEDVASGAKSLGDVSEYLTRQEQA